MVLAVGRAGTNPRNLNTRKEETNIDYTVASIRSIVVDQHLPRGGSIRRSPPSTQKVHLSRQRLMCTCPYHLDAAFRVYATVQCWPILRYRRHRGVLSTFYRDIQTTILAKPHTSHELQRKSISGKPSVEKPGSALQPVLRWSCKHFKRGREVRQYHKIVDSVLQGVIAD